ncbi:hypothetical protein [Singulisphaera sp. PoT]|uniref:hypothetical protein n=1 Tax=Singulisphaera sp. PoT TaxID=3411797 RepID=UPI003BF5BA4E
MNPAKVAFLVGVALALSLAIVLINALPLIFDVLTVSVWTLGGIVLGRKSTAWF